MTTEQAMVEDKSEVKKAGGVYYTPQFIVDYIVGHTVGEKIKNKTPGDVTKIKILDPACGSGFFLLGAYQLLMDYHLNYYTGGLTRKSDKISRQQQSILKKALKENKIYQSREDEYQLTIAEKHNILLNNIFGVDIDRQAVEMTKMSLLLKLLEGESMESSGQLCKYSDIKLLPDLSDNIKCGNSLIGSDFYEKGQMSLFQDEETIRRINAFDWETEFPGIFQKGGFHVVIGNPPYFSISTIEKQIVYYLEKKYSEIHTGYNDIMYYFIYKCIKLLEQNGVFGFITSNYYIGNTYAKKIRNFLKEYVFKILNFRDYKVFGDANVHTNIIIANKIPGDKTLEVLELRKCPINNTLDLEANFTKFVLHKESLEDNWIITNDANLRIIRKMALISIDLGVITEIEKGSTSGKNKIFTVKKEFANELNLEKEILRKNIKNSHLERYHIIDSGYFIIYIDNDINIDRYPNIKNYLSKHITELLNRNEVKKGLYQWYRLERPRKKYIFDSAEKLIVPYRAESNRFAYDNQQYFNDGGDIRVIILKKNVYYSLKYILGILNSRLMNWYYQFIGKPKGSSREYFNKPLAKIPIRKLAFANRSEKNQHDKIVHWVDQMLELQKKFHAAKIETEKTLFKKQIDMKDKQIDQLVYELYRLTDQEIKIVEEDIGD
ncbi:MAG: TaqI-like C-terminal specificity domain-containing protein [Candidatus Aminicenantes bacterium]|jgi:hypothetical protein